MRFFPQTEQDKVRMLEVIGAGSIEELFKSIPEECRFRGDLNIGEPMDEIELSSHMNELASANTGQYPCFKGAGFYDHFIPAVVDALSKRSEFYTAYTPYQPEASQGHLQIFYEFQTMICSLTGMDISNASMYDGASGLAEAALMACRLKKNLKKAVVSSAVNPEYINVLKTYLSWAGIGLEIVETGIDGLVDKDDLENKVENAAVFLFQNPNFFGLIEEGGALCSIAHSKGAYACVSVNPVSLGILKRPGDYDADIVAGEGQPFGNPMYFGGHGFGILAVKQEFVRKIPGRIVGKTVDRNGKECCVLTLQTREQHIRRGRATSNICSNQAWCVTRACIHLSALGPKGLSQVAEISASRAHQLARRCAEVNGYSLVYPASYFNEFVLKCPVSAKKVNEELFKNGILGGVELDRYFPDRHDEMLVCVTEKRTDREMDVFVRALSKVGA